MTDRDAYHAVGSVGLNPRVVHKHGLQELPGPSQPTTGFQSQLGLALPAEAGDRNPLGRAGEPAFNDPQLASPPEETGFVPYRKPNLRLHVAFFRGTLLKTAIDDSDRSFQFLDVLLRFQLLHK